MNCLYVSAPLSNACMMRTIVHMFVVGEGASLIGRGLNFSGCTVWEAIGGGIVELNKRLLAIAEDSRAVVLFVPASVQCAAQDLLRLEKVFAEDPLFGFAIPRVASQDQVDRLARVLACLPAHERRVVEGAPVLVRASVFRDFGLLDEFAANLDSALAQLFVRANRRGISARLVNSVLLRSEGEWPVVRDLQLTRASDHAKAIVAQAALPEIRFERLLHHRYAEKSMWDVLIDIRNLAPGFNGTAHHVLALLEPLSCLAVARRMRLYFWVLPESADFHRLGELYGDAVVHVLPPEQIFDASIRLSQPWSLTELRDQAHVSTVNIYSVLDTIAWDCHYIRMPHLEGVWRVMADHADGFVYNSAFTKERFLARFPAAREAEQKVAHCSMDPAEYWTKDNVPAQADDSEPYVLIVGNYYYHKGLAEVVPALSAGFPEVRFKVLGECSGSFHNVEQLRSGTQSAESMASLFEHCTCLVFPSFYEGFGLPIFEALAFGKPVLARYSELIDELRSHIEPVSTLVSFVSMNDLLRGLKTLLLQQAGLKRQGQPAVHPAQPYRWEDSASDVLDLIDGLLAREDFSRCRERLEFFYRLEMFDVERAGWADARQNMVSFEVEKEE